MLIDLFTPPMGLELALTLTIATLLGLLFKDWMFAADERRRLAYQKAKIQKFIDAANKIEGTIDAMTAALDPNEIDDILRKTNIEDLININNAIAKAEAETAKLKNLYTGKIQNLNKAIGLTPTGGNDKQKNNAQQNQQNGSDTGKKLLSELLGRLKQAGKSDLDFNRLLKLLKDNYGINNPTEFAALPEAKQQEIEASLRA
jgi:hypothetical protein